MKATQGFGYEPQIVAMSVLNNFNVRENGMFVMKCKYIASFERCDDKNFRQSVQASLDMRFIIYKQVKTFFNFCSKLGRGS